MPKHVTYPGPHLEVRVPGIAEPVRQGVEIEVESDLADSLIAQGWTSGPRRAARERTDETADAPRAGRTPAAGTFGDTADAPAIAETATAARARPTT